MACSMKVSGTLLPTRDMDVAFLTIKELSQKVIGKMIKRMDVAEPLMSLMAAFTKVIMRKISMMASVN